MKVALIDAADLDLEIDQLDPDRHHHTRQKVVHPQRKVDDIVHVLLAGPSEGRDMLLRDERIAQGVVLVAIFDDGPRQRRTLFDPEAFRHRTGGEIAHDHFQRNDLAGPAQLFAHVQTTDEMGRHADVVQTGHEEFRQPVVQHALALDHVLFLGVEGGGIILEVLHDRARLGAFIQDLGLAFIDFLASCHGRTASSDAARESRLCALLVYLVICRK